MGFPLNVTKSHSTVSSRGVTCTNGVGSDCRRQRGAGRPVRTLSQRCRSEKGSGVDWGAGGGDGQEGPVQKGARQN